MGGDDAFLGFNQVEVFGGIGDSWLVHCICQGLLVREGQFGLAQSKIRHRTRCLRSRLKWVWGGAGHSDLKDVVLGLVDANLVQAGGGSGQGAGPGGFEPAGDDDGQVFGGRHQAGEFIDFGVQVAAVHGGDDDSVDELVEMRERQKPAADGVWARR